MLSIRLPEELELRLENFAASHNHSKSFFAKEAIQMYLDDMEDAEEAMLRLSDPNAKYISTEELLGSLDV